jgi:DNA-binding response OmpR family regulator
MRRILVVEDDHAMNQHIADILNKAGFKVSSAFDGVAGLEAVRTSTPDLIVLDIFMPEKDGLEMLVELRRAKIDVPVLIISGKQHLLSGSSMSLAEQLGASGTLAKPFTPKELLNHVCKFAGILPVDAKKAATAGSASK